MRDADAVTLARVLLVFITAYFILIKLDSTFVVILLLFVFALDWTDGYLAARQKGTKKMPKYGAYLDIAGDRVVEYVLWILFTYLKLIPLFVIFIIVTRNSFADALLSSSGKTFSKMETLPGKVASSHVSRGAYAALKAMNFIYLSLVAVAAWPASIAYLLTAVVVLYSVLRGVAEVYEAFV